MGGPNPDRWPPEDWRLQAETVEEMAAQGWDVFSKCNLCGLMMTTSLNLIARISGPSTSLWNLKRPCRRMGCTGYAGFHGRPPRLGRHIPLEAQWPGRRPAVLRGQR